MKCIWKMIYTYSVDDIGILKTIPDWMCITNCEDVLTGTVDGIPTQVPKMKDTANISQLCHASSEPITITKNGYEDMVIMSAEVYEHIRLYSVYEKLMEAERDIESGAVSDAFDSVVALRGKYGLLCQSNGLD